MRVTSSPKTRMVPESGRMRPLASFIRTDFPPPAGPRMMRVSPRWTVKEMFCRTGLMSKVMETSSKTTTGSAESGLCLVWATSPGAMSAGMVWLPAEDADHRAADDEVDDDDEDGGVDDGLGCRFTDALGAALCGHAEETADGGD